MNQNINKQLIRVTIDSLSGYGGNPRHNNQSAMVVAKSIENFGYINPIVVDEDNVILAGNTRFKAIQILKSQGKYPYEDIEVLQVSGLSNNQKNGFVIADNKVGEYSKWNMAALDRMLENSDLDTDLLESFGILSLSKTKRKLEDSIYNLQGNE